MLHDLPESVVKYSASPVFNETTVPVALLKDHKVKDGVWGRLVVFHGSIDYIIPDVKMITKTVTPSNHAIIEPEVLHHVSLNGPVEFQVEFYRQSASEQSGAAQ